MPVVANVPVPANAPLSVMVVLKFTVALKVSVLEASTVILLNIDVRLNVQSLLTLRIVLLDPIFAEPVNVCGVEPPIINVPEPVKFLSLVKLPNKVNDCEELIVTVAFTILAFASLLIERLLHADATFTVTVWSSNMVTSSSESGIPSASDPDVNVHVPVAFQFPLAAEVNTP